MYSILILYQPNEPRMTSRTQLLHANQSVTKNVQEVTNVTSTLPVGIVYTNCLHHHQCSKKETFSTTVTIHPPPQALSPSDFGIDDIASIDAEDYKDVDLTEW